VSSLHPPSDEAAPHLEACSKYLVHIGELLRLFWREIRGENAIQHAFSSQELAGIIGRVRVAR